MKLRALLIDPIAKTVTAIETTGHFDDFYRLLACATVQAVMLTASEALYLDEDGLLADEPGPFFAIRGFPEPYAGRSLIIGINEAGVHVDSKMMLAETAAMVSFPDIKLVGFEPISGSTVIRGQKVQMIGNKAIFKRRDEGH